MSIQIWQHFAEGMGMQVTWQASDYYAFVVMMCLLTGLTFQFPLALIVLMWLELVRPKTLLKSWRGMLVGIMLLVALITPIAEPISLLVMTGVLFSFYLAAVAVGTVIVQRKRVARGDKPYPEDDDLPDDDEDDSSYQDESRPKSRKPVTPADSSPAPAKPKSTPPPAEGDLSSLD
jgi:sec-independent protein translocase protein TatC